MVNLTRRPAQNLAKTSARLQMRFFSYGTSGSACQVRFVREDNGAGPKEWHESEYLAWIDWRRFVGTA